MKQFFVAAGALICAAAFAQISPAVVQSEVKHTLTPKQLSALGGKYYFDKSVKAILGPQLKPLLGSKWTDFDRAFNVTSPMTFKGDTLYGRGHWGPLSVAFEMRSDGFLAAAYLDSIEKKCTDFGKVNPGYLCEELE